MLKIGIHLLRERGPVRAGYRLWWNNRHFFGGSRSSSCLKAFRVSRTGKDTCNSECCARFVIQLAVFRCCLLIEKVGVLVACVGCLFGLMWLFLWTKWLFAFPLESGVLFWIVTAKKGDPECNGYLPAPSTGAIRRRQHLVKPLARVYHRRQCRIPYMSVAETSMQLDFKII